MRDEKLKTALTETTANSAQQGTQSALLSSEARFQELLHAVGDGIFGVDTQGSTTFINAAALRLLGYAEGALLGRNIHEVIHHTRADGTACVAAQCPIRATLDGGIEQRVDDDIFWRGDGAALPVSYVSTPMRDAHSGHIVGAVVTFRDLTESKKAAARLHAILTNARCILWRAEVQKRPLPSSETNPYLAHAWHIGVQDERAAQQVLPLETAPGLSYAAAWLQCRHPEEVEPARALAFASLESGQSGYSQEFRCVDRHGQWHWLHEETTIVPVGDGHWELYGVATDVTALKRVEEELRYREALLRETGNSAKVGGWELDVATGEGHLTEEVLHIHDLPPDAAMTAEKGLDYYVPEHRPRIAAAVQAAIDEGTSYDLELEIISARGQRKWVRTIGHPEREDGKTVRLWGSFQDISDLRRMEAARESERRRVALLADITERLLVCEAPDEVLPAICSDVARELNAEFFFNYELDAEQRLHLKNCGGLTAQQSAAVDEVAFGQSLCGLTALRGEPLVLGDVLASPLPQAAIVRQLGVQAYACHPLFNGQRVFGTLAFATTSRSHFSDDEVRLMKTVSDHVTAAIEKAGLLSEVRQSEARLRRLLGGLPVAAYTCDTQGRVTFYNEQAVALWGARPSSEIHPGQFGGAQRSFFSDGTPMSREQSWVAKALREGAPQYGYEIIVERADGTRRHVLANTEPLYDAKGVLTGAVNVGLDITERKQTEEALRRSEASLSLAQRIAQLGYMEIHAQSGLVRWTDETFRLLGVDKQTKPSLERFLQAVHPDDAALMADLQGEFLQSSPAQAREVRIIRPDGEIRWLQMQPHRFRGAQGELLLYGATLLDITERKQWEQELNHSRDRLSGIVNSAMDAIITIDEAQQILLLNPAAERMFGYTSAQAIGQSIEMLMPQRFRAEHQNRVKTYSASGEMKRPLDQPGPILGLRANGEEFPLEASISLTRLENEKLFTVILRDITERVRAEQELQRLNDELEERVRQRTGEAEAARAEAERANLAKSEFLSRMSHELRTPMNSILGFAQLMEMSATDAKEAERVSYILKSGQHLLKLINEVLDIARVESGNLKMAPESVHLPIALQTALDIIKPLCEQRNIRLHFDKTPCADAYVQADPQRLSQILLNLLSNAAKYNRPGGEVRVQCLLSEERRARVEIADSGPGIAPEKMSRLFQPFERLGAETSSVEGTGLGLSLTKHLVEAMGGAIGVRSTPGQGSTFFIELEQAASPEQKPLSGNETLAHDGFAETKTILYIEDNLANLQVIQHILADYQGVRLLSAMQGGLGLELAREHKPSLILLDLHLPDIQGDEVLKRLMAAPETGNIPVIIISADATPNQIRRLLLSGATEYLTKPIDVKRLLELLHELLA